MRRLYLRSPTCVLNVVMQLLSGASSSWWYPDERSNLLKTVAPLRSATRSSIVGIRCLTALLASRMSTHILTWPDLLGTMTIRLTQGVGPVTVSMMSSSSNRFNSISTSFLTCKEIRRCGCCLEWRQGQCEAWWLFLLLCWFHRRGFLNLWVMGDWGQVSSGLTWLMILSTPSSVALLKPRRFPEAPLLECRVDHVLLVLTNISASIVPRTGRGVGDP